MAMIEETAAPVEPSVTGDAEAPVRAASAGSLFERLFRVTGHGSTVSREILAGFTCFAAMSYVVIVNPAVMATTGMDRDSLIITTAVVSMLGTLMMGLAANLPIGMAPGMGPNIVFSQVLVLELGVSWRIGLAIVFINAIIFVAVALSSWREKIVAGFPDCIKIGIQCGVGLMISYLGLRGGGLAVSTASGVSMGHLSDPGVLLTFVGMLATPVLIVTRVPGAFLMSIAVIALVGLVVPTADGHGFITTLPTRILAWPKAPTDVLAAWDFKGYFQQFFILLPVAIYLLVSDFFAETSTFMCVARRAGLMTADGGIPRARQAYTADALSSAIGASMGTSTVNAYVESVAGIEAGGRTGLTAVITALLFGAALFLWPVLAVIPPQATAPTLIIVGVMMMEGIKDLDLSKAEDGVPPILILLITVTTMNLAAAMAVGCFSYTLMLAGQRRWEKITPMLLGIDGVLAIYCVAAALVK